MADLHLNDRLRIDATLLRFFHRAKHHEHANLKSTAKPAEISFLRKNADPSNTGKTDLLHPGFCRDLPPALPPLNSL